MPHQRFRFHAPRQRRERSLSWCPRQPVTCTSLAVHGLSDQPSQKKIQGYANGEETVLYDIESAKPASYNEPMQTYLMQIAMASQKYFPFWPPLPCCIRATKNVCRVESRPCSWNIRVSGLEMATALRTWSRSHAACALRPKLSTSTELNWETETEGTESPPRKSACSRAPGSTGRRASPPGMGVISGCSVTVMSQKKVLPRISTYSKSN